MNTRWAQRLGFAAWAGLAAVQVIWHAWLMPPRAMPVAVAMVIALVPLALPVVYWRRPQRALLLAGMIGLFYFCHGIAEAWAVPRERVLALVEIILASMLVLAQARMPKRRRRVR